MLLNDLRLEILEEFVGDYSAMLTGSSIAKSRGLNQKSVANALSELEKKGFVKSKLSGKNRQFFLNFDDTEMLVNLLSSVEHLRTIKFYEKNPLVKEVASNIIPFCSGIVAVFGSYAKGKQRKESDLDLFVIGKCNEKEIGKISDAYNLEISVKKYPEGYFKRPEAGKDVLLKEVIRNHIILSDVQQFVANLARCYYGKD